MKFNLAGNVRAASHFGNVCAIDDTFLFFW